METIFDKAAALSGELSDSEQTLLTELCSVWEKRLAASLKSDVGREDCASAFDISAALLAAAALREIGVCGGFDSFSVGDVSISGTGAENAALMRRQAELIMAPYVIDGGFSFKGVAG